jgi:peptide/nickel transport system substrate-binding protein
MRSSDSASSRQSSLRARLACTVLGVAVLVVSACGPSATPAPGAPTGGAQTPARGGTLTIDIGADRLKGLDHTSYDGLDRDVANLVVETLVWYDKNTKVVPRLATSWKTESDQLTWTFELRSGVKFTDGTPFNAEAVRSEFVRKMNMENALAFRNVGRHMDTVTVVDEDTIKLKTKVPLPIFPNILLGYGSEISSPAAVQQFGKDIGVKQVGTGPYKIEAMVAGGNLTLVRNDGYWGEKPLLDKLVMIPIADPSARTAALVSGQTDLMWKAPPSQLAALKQQQPLTLKLVPSLTQYHWSFNVGKAPLDKVEVRQGINHAIDMKEIKDVAWEGLQEPFIGPLNPALYDEDPSIQGLPFNLEKARELLQKNGITTTAPLKLEYVYATDPTLDREAQVLQAQLRKVGIELVLVPAEVATVAQRTERGALRFDIARTGWSNSQVTMAPALANLMKSGGSSNIGQFKDDKIDALITQLESEFDEAKRSTIVKDLTKEYFRAAPWFGGYSQVLAYAWRGNVRGFEPVGKEALYPFLMTTWRAP